MSINIGLILFEILNLIILIILLFKKIKPKLLKIIYIIIQIIHVIVSPFKSPPFDKQTTKELNA